MHHAPGKAKNSVPPFFFEKAGDNKMKIVVYHKFCLALNVLNVFTTYDNIKGLSAFFCFAQVSLCPRLYEEQRKGIKCYPWPSPM